jgi:hypothetical protein
MEPPETPAAIFALRAFKSAIFGTPRADDDEEPDPTLHEKDHQAKQALQETNALLGRLDLNPPNIDHSLPPTQPLASPTKSILVTPGTAPNRRKTVSFGDGILEKEHNDDRKPQRPSKTTPVTVAVSGSSRLEVNQPKVKNSIRSRLTQTLIDARDNSSKEPLQVTQNAIVEEQISKESSETKGRGVKESDAVANNTINLDEPRSESGKYWKTEFENYRQRTNREMRKLIQYRSAAKSYARKKDAEALRLAEKLKKEEAKVTEMERHVASLASTMIGDGSKEVNKEQIVEELTKQTALAVHFKQKANTLRKVLQRHGVIGNDEDPSDCDESTGQKKEKVAKEADGDHIQVDRNAEFERLKELAQTSERKAADLEKENLALKQTLARVKQEMNKYEGRRKEKEDKLKQRETKLETKNAEYRDKLKASARERRDTEDTLKRAWQDERKLYQDQIEALKSKLANMENIVRVAGSSQDPRHRRDSVGVYAQDSAPRLERSNTVPSADLLQLGGSMLDRGQSSYARQPARHSYQDTRSHQQPVTSVQAEVEPLIYFDDASPITPRRRSLGAPGPLNGAPVTSPPSALRVVESAVNAHQGRPGYQRQYRESPRPSMVTFPAISGQMENVRNVYVAPHHVTRKSAS